jgi:uncharacterized integral membrane protein
MQLYLFLTSALVVGELSALRSGRLPPTPPHPHPGENACNNLILIHLLTTIGLTPGGSSTVHIYTQTMHRATQLTTLVERLSGIRTQTAQTKINDEQIQ